MLHQQPIQDLEQLILNRDTISENDIVSFKSWYCKDYVNGGKILVEVGFFGDPYLEGIGFILYEGGYYGEITNYHRTGIEHRWDWGPHDNDYTFLIKPDGTGLYYDFSTVAPGEKTKAKDVYKCHQR